MEHKTDTSGHSQQPTDVTKEPIGNKMFILSKREHQENFIRNDLEQILHLQRVPTVEECDGILVFCTIVSRAGTDIDAAVNELNALSESKPAVFMVLHHTFDPEKIIEDSNRYVTRRNTLSVDCLFNEDEGLLKCVRNNEALEKIKQNIEPHIFDKKKGFCQIS